MSLPYNLGLSQQQVLQVPPIYLKADLSRADYFRRRLPSGPKLALAWQGNPAFEADRERSMPFSYLVPLVEMFSASATFVSLQKHNGREALQNSTVCDRVLDWTQELDRDDAFVDSMAMLTQVDLLITTDTGLAHLAGAQGIPTWLLLSAVPDWRWGVEGESTAWYPSLRLFRQRTLGDWGDVVRRIATALTAELSGHS
jgi:ADP-heptose:LPS heptosyltransferase